MGEFIILCVIICFIWYLLNVIFSQDVASHSSKVKRRNYEFKDRESSYEMIETRTLRGKTLITTSKSLTGKKLLEKVNELGDISKAEIVKACGYSFFTHKGERLNYTSFYEALLEAKGISLPANSGESSKGSEKLNYIATVNNNGEIEIDKEYTDLQDLKPGDQFKIKLGRNGIRLIPVGLDEKEWLLKFSDPDELERDKDS